MKDLLKSLAFAFLLASGCADAFAEETVKLAYIAYMSGPFALLGEEALTAFQAAADMVNARGGVAGGRRIEIVPFDNKGTAQESLVVLKQAIDQDIHFVMSTVSSNAHAISDAVVKHNARNADRPVLFLDYAQDPALTEGKCNFWHFRFEAHTDMQVNVLTGHMARQPEVQKVYLINQDYAFGQAVSRAAREMLLAKRPDIQIVGDDLVPLGKVKDFAPYVAKIRASGADSVLTSNWGSDLSLLIKASNEAGLKAAYFTYLAFFPGTPSAIGAAGADRLLSLGAWHINAADSAWEKALMGYKAKYKALSNLDYLVPYRIVEMVASAMNKSGSIDPVKVAYALEGLRYAGPSGESWMRQEDHQLIAPNYIMSFRKAGQAGVKHDEEGTGYGWKTEARVDAISTVPPIKCQMERPSRVQ
jgi:branched-chain amino acid transport system substrate-binding protein